MVRFHFLAGDVNWRKYGGKWISQKLNNGDFDYWLVMELIDMIEATGDEDQPRYNVTLSAVSPQTAGDENIRKAGDGFTHPTERAIDVEALHSYGIYDPLWQDNGNNSDKLLKIARKESQVIPGLFGFYMDAPENKIGSTGWDCITGDLLAGLNRLMR